MLRRLAAGVTLVAALALAGCTPPEPTESTTPVATPSPTTTTGVAIDAFAAAEQFNELVDQSFATNQVPSAELAALATPEVVDRIELEVSTFAEQSLRTEGTSVLEGREAVEATGDDALALLTCLDTSGVTTFGPDGPVQPGGVPRQPWLFEFNVSDGAPIITYAGPPPEPRSIPGCGS